MPYVPRVRPLLAIGLVLAATTLAAPVPAAAQDAGPQFEQACGGTSWWAGSTNVCDGTVVYRDYVNDDQGADDAGLGYERGTQSAFGTLAHPAGDKRYPTEKISSADLVRLELTRNGDRVEVLAELAALYTARDTVLALTIDTDGDQATGGGAWGDLLANNSIPLSSVGWEELVLLTEGDPDTNTIRGSFRLPAAASWRVQAATAQAANRNVMNVAFRGVNEQAAYRLEYRNPGSDDKTLNIPSNQGAWFEDLQADALSSGIISKFGQVIRTADLAPGIEILQQIGPGLHERVYTSAYTVPAPQGQFTESFSYAGVKGRGQGGSSTAFSQVFNLLGRYLPYGVYVPDTSDPEGGPDTGGPFGLQMEWHGSNQGIVAQINQPGMQRRFGDELGRLLVTPSSRGPNGYGSDVSERDLLDVMTDIRQTLPVDNERVFSSGYSQGGYITFRMAMLYPQLFAGFTSFVGFTGNNLNLPGEEPPADTPAVNAGAVGNMLDFVPNLRNVPGSLLYGREDAIVPFSSALAIRERFDDSDNAYEFWAHSPADHFTFAIADSWIKEAAYSRDQRRVVDPARVTYRTATFLGNAGLGIRHDTAYWVSAIVPRTGDPVAVRTQDYADTDLTSRGCGTPVPVVEKNDGVSPVGTEPVSYTTDAQRVTGTAALPPGEALTGTLKNVASLTVDVRGSCLAGEVTYRIVSDGDALLTLSDGRRIVLRPGENVGVLAAGAAPAPVIPEAPVVALLPALGLLIGGWAIVLRRRTPRY